MAQVASQPPTVTRQGSRAPASRAASGFNEPVEGKALLTRPSGPQPPLSPPRARLSPTPDRQPGLQRWSMAARGQTDGVGGEE